MHSATVGPKPPLVAPHWGGLRWGRRLLGATHTSRLPGRFGCLLGGWEGRCFVRGMPGGLCAPGRCANEVVFGVCLAGGSWGGGVSHEQRCGAPLIILLCLLLVFYYYTLLYNNDII